MKNIFVRSFYFLSLFAATVAMVGTISQTSHPAHADTSSSLTGYAWSDNIGWISFSGTGYGVNEDTSGNLMGYAWSDNIGWIKFGGLSGFPTGGSTYLNASIDGSGTMHGWARACAGTVNASNSALPGDCSSMTSRTDGWDGWISLDGSNYGVIFGSGNAQYSQSAYTYAWGSDVIGWISFNPSNLNSSSNPGCDNTKEVCWGGSSLTPSVSLLIAGSNGAPATSATITQGSSATLSWSTSNITTCTGGSTGTSGADNSWNPSASSFATSTGTSLTQIFNTVGTETYSLSCTANSQTGSLSRTQIPSAPATVTLTINSSTSTTTSTSTNPGGNASSTCPAVVNATMCSGTSGATSGLVSSQSQCSANTTMCEWYCSSGYRQVGNQCVSNGTIREQ